MSKKKGIVLNRMYTGSYLSSNLGHEVINMFQADNGKHYLYLNARGNFDSKIGKDISDMLLVRYVGENQLEILAWASELTPAPGADKSYKKFEPQGDIRTAQGYIISSKERKSIEENREYECWEQEIEPQNDISYGGANLIDIFAGSEQQNIYITYRAGKFRTPKGRLFLEFVDDADFYSPSKSETGSLDNESIFYFSGYLLGKTTLHQYIYTDDPYTINNNSWGALIKEKKNKKLNSLEDLDREFPKKNGRYLKLKALLERLGDNNITFEDLKGKIESDINDRRSDSYKKLLQWLNDQNWEETKIKKVDKSEVEQYKPREKSLFDIVPKLQRDENCFSDALKFFMNRDKEEWQGIFNALCNGADIGSILSIEREKDATISNKRKDDDQTSNSDNNDKSSSKIKGGRIDLLVRTQNAYIVIENKIKSGINCKTDDPEGYDQLDRYKNYVLYRILGDRINQLEDDEKRGDLEQMYNQITVDNFSEVKEQIEEDLKETVDIEAYYFVLAPDYNMPNEDERKGYKPLYYSTLVGDRKRAKENENDDYRDALGDVTNMMEQYNKKHQSENLWSAFYDAMKRHSYDYENDSLYEDMKNTFFARIQKCPKVSSNTENNA